MKLSPSVKTAWLAALRSGEYRQGTGLLRIDDEYCCLGVLCEVAAQHRLVRFDDEEFHYVSITDPNEFSSGSLPLPVARWAGLVDELNVPSVDPIVRIQRGDTEQRESLSAINDHFAYDFDRIADLIEEQL